MVLSDTEENAPDQDKDNRLELILEKARLKREVEIQEESHRRQMSSLRQEILLNQSLVQSMLKEVQVKNERILELELKAVRATILRKEGGVPREQGGSPTHGNSALMATISTRRPQGPQDPNSTPMGSRGLACPHLEMGSRGEEVPALTVEREGVTGIPGQVKYRLDQISAELAEGNTRGSDECFENAVPNQASRERRLVI